MKKVICLLLVAILCMTLPIAAFAESVQSPGPTVPTGDSTPIDQWLILMVVALAALIVTVVVFKKTEKK